MKTFFYSDNSSFIEKMMLEISNLINIYICFEKYLLDYSSLTPEFALHVSRYSFASHLLPESGKF